jgi:SNF2 family DNA or RNA helicase
VNYSAYIDGDYIVFNVPFHFNHLAKACGSRWHTASKRWRVKPSKIVAAAVRNTFPAEEIDPAIIAMAGAKAQIPALDIDPQAVVRDVKLRDTQLKAIEKAWPHAGFALFHVMGAGKTLSSIALTNLRRSYDMIDRLLVVCPTSIKGVWKKEFERYSALPHDLFVMESGGKVPDFKEFPIMVVGVEALSQGGAFEEAARFVAGGKTKVIVDESSTIKNYDANRTERCWKLGEQAEARLILTGTNVTQGLQDLYSQMYFVDPTIIGELSFFGFRNKYCVMGGFENRKIVGYRDPRSLLDRIRPYCDVIRKDDLKDLPPKQYQTRDVKASPAQHKACKELAREMKTKLGEKELSVQNALEALLRFQQIAGGYDHEGQPLGSNPKMAELVALLEDFDGKAIIWARYLPEIAGITTELDKRWPGGVLSLWGEVPPESRQAMVDEFQSNPKVRFFVSNQATGGKGITLTAATLSVYYSNTASLEDRLQSEDRNHRIGQFNAVTYVDLVSDLKVDRMILNLLQNKLSVAVFANNGLKVDDFI